MANQPDTGPITLINVFEIRSDDVEQVPAGVAGPRPVHGQTTHPAIYRAVIETTAE